MASIGPVSCRQYKWQYTLGHSEFAENHASFQGATLWGIVNKRLR